MSERMQAPVCEHYWAWVSPAGSRLSARLCMLCHQPDPDWLNHVVEVDLGDACQIPGCLHCEFADATTTRPGDVRGTDHTKETGDE